MIMTCVPAGKNPKCKGRSSDSFFGRAFPIFMISGKEYDQHVPQRIELTATGIVPDFHRIPFSPPTMKACLRLRLHYKGMKMFFENTNIFDAVSYLCSKLKNDEIKQQLHFERDSR